MMNSARNYEAMQQIAADFQARALMMVTLLQQPVPLAYYHILKLMQVSTPPQSVASSRLPPPLGIEKSLQDIWLRSPGMTCAPRRSWSTS